MWQYHIREANRLSCNEAIQVRQKHNVYDSTFFREGGSTLYPEECAFLGDVVGLSVVHLQCNCGEDTLSLVRLGAIATGVDISDTAIEATRSLALTSGVPAAFQRMDVYDWLEQGAQHFDMAFCSYGTLMWLPDLGAWARGIAAILKPGGRFALLELHPTLLMFDYDWTLKFPYSSEGKTLVFEEGVEAIVRPASGNIQPVEAFTNPYPTYEFAWGIGDVVTALVEAGLTIRTLKEYLYAHTNHKYERMRQNALGQWLPPEGIPNMPLVYGIMAQKKRNCSGT